MTLSATIKMIDNHWASYLGCSSADLQTARTVILSHHTALAAYQGVFVFRHEAVCIVSAPESWITETQRALQGLPPHEVFDPAVLQHAFAAAVPTIIGPASLAYADASDFQPVDVDDMVRVLTPDDRDVLDALEAACEPLEWEHSSIGRGHDLLFGCFQRGILVAAGACPSVGETIRNVGIITHPAYRAQGWGRAVVSAMTTYGLTHQNIMMYRTLVANRPSIRIAQSLGYQEYAQTIALRLGQR